MTGFENPCQHLPPQFNRRNGSSQTHLAIGSILLVLHVTLFKRLTVQIVQVRSFVRAEQRPILLFHHSLHKQVRNPVGGVHVVSTTTLVTGVLSQVQELFDIQVPSFQVRTNRTFSLTTLIDCHSGIADDLQKRNHTLALTIGSTDVRIGCSNVRPVISKTASPLR